MPDQATWFADPATYPFWEHAAAKNIPVCVQMKQEGIPLLRQIMDRFPKVTIILDHLARTPFEDGPPYAGAADFLALAKYKQVYLKITPVNVSPKSWGKGTPETFFGKFIDSFGASRIAWGSNFPEFARHAWPKSSAPRARHSPSPAVRSGLDFRQDRALALSEH